MAELKVIKIMVFIRERSGMLPRSRSNVKFKDQYHMLRPQDQSQRSKSSLKVKVTKKKARVVVNLWLYDRGYEYCTPAMLSNFNNHSIILI